MDSPVNSSTKGRNERFSRYILLALLAVSALAFFPVISVFLAPIILATAFTVLFYPLYSKVLKLTRGRKTLSSLLCCLILLIGVLIPISILFDLMLRQMIELYGSAQPQLRELFEKGRESRLYRQLIEFPISRWLLVSPIDWQQFLQNSLQQLTTLGTVFLNRTSAGVLGFITDVFIIFFTMFYFFMDGEGILIRLRMLSPVKSQHVNLIFLRFFQVSRATIRGTLVVGFIQGSLGALTLLIFGVKTWALWGFVMVILSIIPLLGAWMVLIPSGIIQILMGNLWQGIGIIAVSLVVVSNIDNLIRPRLVGQRAKMHDLMIFFSTLGGLSLFGVSGFIIGPVIASFFVALVDIYETEFGSHLNQIREKRSAEDSDGSQIDPV
ncbi:MAG: AI-2E family transporter [Fibrobacter sp.]|nr:AI-2E family transporter [Fibrobacter sp.]